MGRLHRTKISCSLLIGALCTIGISFYLKWAPNVQSEHIHSPDDFERAERLFFEGQFDAAVDVIERYFPEIEKGGNSAGDWLRLYMQVNQKAENRERLYQVYRYAPDLFAQSEQGALLVADFLIEGHRLSTYREMRKLWEGRERDEEGWFLLDGDALVVEGRLLEAVDHLQSKELIEQSDAARLTRLALILGREQPKKAWQYLEQAYQRDLGNPQIVSYRAQLLESIGKNSLAHQEYLSALNLGAGDFDFIHDLAQFYLRQGKYALALALWRDHLLPPSRADFWVAALFWNRVAVPTITHWEKGSVPQGPLQPFTTYLMELSPKKYWDHDLFLEKVSHPKSILTGCQESFWLRLIQALIDREEELAKNLIKFNPFATSLWMPDLERAIWTVLHYRKSGNFVSLGDISLLGRPKRHEHQVPPFFTQLESFVGKQNREVPEEIHTLLGSEAAFSSLFLAAALPEAALALHPGQVLPSEIPGWIGPSFAQAVEQSRGAVEALALIRRQPKRDGLELTRAEILIRQGKPDQALAALGALALQPSQVGFRAAQLASLLYIEKTQYADARQAVRQNLSFSDSISGKELLGRIAHLEGKVKKADFIYQSIAKESTEARSYLARRAFEQKNWEEARRLTQELLQESPTSEALRQNLEVIEQKKRDVK